MQKKVVSGIMLTLLIGISALTFNLQLVKAEPRTWIVDDDGPADFHTIQEAINHANEGDTIFVKAGIYYENVILNKSLSLIGENKTTTIIDGNGRGNVIDCSESGHEFSYAIIEGFTIRNGNQILPFHYDTGVPLGGVSLGGFTIVRNNIIENNFCGLYSWYMYPVTIQNNTIINNYYGIGFLVAGSDPYPVIVEGNTFQANVIGFEAWVGEGELQVLNNIFISNEIGLNLYCTASDGNAIFRHNNFMLNNCSFLFEEISGHIDIDFSNTINGKILYYFENLHDVVISNENLQDSGCLAIVDSSNVTIENLTLSHGCQGLLMYRVTDAMIRNITSQFNYEGINLFYVNNATVENNTFNFNEYGLRMQSSDYCTFRSNVFANNSNSLSLFGVGLDNFVTNELDTSNTVDGNPVCYMKNVNDFVVNSSTLPEVGYLALVNSTRITIEDLEIVNAGDGILMAYVDSFRVTNVSITKSEYAVKLIGASNGLIESNKMTQCLIGIYMWQSSDCNITNNVMSNIFFGIRITSYTFNICIAENIIENSFIQSISVLLSSIVAIERSTIKSIRLYRSSVVLANCTVDRLYAYGGEVTAINSTINILITDPVQVVLINSIVLMELDLPFQMYEDRIIASFSDELNFPLPESIQRFSKYMNVTTECTNDFEVQVRIYYNETQLEETGMDETRLRMYYLTDSGIWQLCSLQDVNTVENYVWTNVTHFSCFVIGGQIAPFLIEGPYYTWYGAEYWIVELAEHPIHLVSNY